VADIVAMVCRDLRPANVLLGDRGHVLLTYFSQWNTVERRVSDQAVDGLYSAPGLASTSVVSYHILSGFKKTFF